MVADDRVVERFADYLEELDSACEIDVDVEGASQQYCLDVCCWFCGHCCLHAVFVDQPRADA